jgi:hypothetical protein
LIGGWFDAIEPGPRPAGGASLVVARAALCFGWLDATELGPRGHDMPVWLPSQPESGSQHANRYPWPDYAAETWGSTVSSGPGSRVPWCSLSSHAVEKLVNDHMAMHACMPGPGVAWLASAVQAQVTQLTNQPLEGSCMLHA